MTAEPPMPRRWPIDAEIPRPIPVAYPPAAMIRLLGGRGADSRRRAERTIGDKLLHLMLGGAAVLAAVGVAPNAAAQFAQIQVSANQRFLQTADGEPFFWLADTAWQLYRLDAEELDQYMTNRVDKGFNVIQGPYLLHDTHNVFGEINGDPANPNHAWFDHIDTIFDKAEQHGLYLAPVIAKGQYADRFTLQSAYDFGYYVGDRYRDRPNIIAFLVGAEFNHPVSNVAIWDEIARGLGDAMGEHLPMLTAHPKWYGGPDGQSSSCVLHNKPWLSFNMHQSALYGDCTNDPEHMRYYGTHNWLLIEHDYALTPIKPVLDGEATYEMQDPYAYGCTIYDGRWDAFGVCRRAYWSVFAGGFGHSYGANGVIQFHKENDPNPIWAPLHYWEEAMEYPGSEQMGHMKRLMESRPFFTRIPGQDFLLSDPDSNVPTHAHATRGAEGGYAMVYIPEPDRTVTVDMSMISGDLARAWWFDPVTGEPTLIGEFDQEDWGQAQSLEFTTPATSDHSVLVVGDAERNFPPPGEPFTGNPIGDLNGDGAVDVADLLLLLAAWGPCTGCAEDLNFDGTVNVLDLLLVLANWS